MLSARPLFDNAADARYFVQPPVWAMLVRGLERRLNVMMIGARGAGKTTLLRQLQAALRAQSERVVFIDATGADSAEELVGRVRDGLTGRPSAPDEGSSTLAGASQALQVDLGKIGEADPAIVLVDASSAASAVYETFGRLRDTLWQFEHRWLVAIDNDDRATALKPPADAFFDVVEDLEPFAADELARAIKLRSPDLPAATLRHVAANAAGNPRRAVRALSQAAVSGNDPASALAAHAALETRASLIGRPHGMLMAELLGRGQASASDRDLQRSLGVSRARLSQLLSELFDHELVIQDVELPAGPGRPRTIYRPNLP